MATSKQKAKKRGRPMLPKGEVKSKITPIRFQGDERNRFEKAAQRAGLSLSEWIRQTLNAAVND
jgi:predicted HicB family RNase H-like nuclease